MVYQPTLAVICRYGITWCIVVRKLAESYINPLKIYERLIGDCGLRPQVVGYPYTSSDIEVVAAFIYPLGLCEREVPNLIKMRDEFPNEIKQTSP